MKIKRKRCLDRCFVIRRNISLTCEEVMTIEQCYFAKLDWRPIDDIIRARKLSLFHKICNGHGPEYFSSYANYVKGSLEHNTRTSRRNDLITPKCKKHSGLRTFHSSATRLWNETELSLRYISSHKRFIRDLQRKMILKNSAAEHFKINYTY